MKHRNPSPTLRENPGDVRPHVLTEGAVLEGDDVRYRLVAADEALPLFPAER